MKALVKILLAVALVTGTATTFAKTVTAVNNSNNISDDRHLSGFKDISVSGSFDYYITQGTNESVKVDAPKDMQAQIITEVKNGALKVYTKNNHNWGSLFSSSKIAVYITLKNVNSIAFSGSGDVYFKGGINAGNLRLTLNGSGDVTGRVNAKALESNVTGSGNLKLSGHADNLKVSLVGSGDFSGHDLAVTNASADVVGSGDISVNASGSLNAHISGSGDIHYKGNPKSINKSVSGSGDINRI